MTLVPCRRQQGLRKTGISELDLIPSRENLTENDDGYYRRDDDEPEVRQ